MNHSYHLLTLKDNYIRLELIEKFAETCFIFLLLGVLKTKISDHRNKTMNKSDINSSEKDINTNLVILRLINSHKIHRLYLS